MAGPVVYSEGHLEAGKIFGADQLSEGRCCCAAVCCRVDLGPSSRKSLKVSLKLSYELHFRRPFKPYT